MPDRHFRAGVGTVIYNEANEVVLWRRSAPPVGNLQFQQGGIDAGEEPETTLWRELKEETGLTKDDCIAIDEYPEWTLQVYPPEILNLTDQPNPDRLGQAHRWWFLQLKPDVKIDLANATDDEFDAYKWVSWEQAIASTQPYKVHIYKALHKYFLDNLS